MKRSSLAISSRLPKSSVMPSLRMVPNSFQNVAYFSGSLSASSASSFSTFFTALERMWSTTRLPCSSSLEMLSGRSLESITPRTNRRYCGISWPLSSSTKTRLMCSLTPRPGCGIHMSYGAREGMNSSSVYSYVPSILLCTQASGSV